MVEYKVTIKIKSPFNIASSMEDKYINKLTLIYNEKPIIPASTIKGKIRSNFYKITELNHKEDEMCTCPMCKIFGQGGFSPSKLIVDNFKTFEEKNTRIKFSNSIDRFRKVSKDNALFSEELVCNKIFTGKLYVYFDEDTIKYKENFEMALKMIDNIGNSKSRGHGYVETSYEEVK
jgi:CRISPR-associated protein Csm3